MSRSHKPHFNSCMLTLAESVLLLLHLRRRNVRSYLTESVLNRLRARIIRKYGVDIDGPPSNFAYELLLCRGGDLQLWPDVESSSIRRVVFEVPL